MSECERPGFAFWSYVLVNVLWMLAIGAVLWAVGQ